MALALNTGHALYGNLLHLIVVDDDNVVKDLVSGQTFTLDSGASVGTGTWGNHLTTVADSYTRKGAAAGTAIPFSTSANPNVTFFYAFNSLSAGWGSDVAVEAGSNMPNISYKTGVMATTEGYSNTPKVTGDDDVTTGAHTVCLTRTAEIAHELFIDAVSDGTGARLCFNSSSVDIAAIGGYNGQGTIGADWVYFAIFNKVLSGTEISDLHTSLGADNAFALLDSGGSSASIVATQVVQTATASGAVTDPPGTIAATQTIQSATASASYTPPPDPSITTDPLKNNTGTVLSGQTVTASVYDISTGALVVRKTGLTSDGSGIVTFSDAAMAAATQYQVVLTIGSDDGITRVTTA